MVQFSGVRSLIAYEDSLIKTNGDKYSFAYNKTVTIDGEGTSASQCASDLVQHNFRTCLFVDSDRIPKWKVSENELIGKGVSIIRWHDTNNTEMQLFSDLPKDKIKHIIEIAVAENNDISIDSILQSINSKLVNKLNTIDDIASYPENEISTLRSSISDSAKNNSWFKTITASEVLGGHLFNEIRHDIETTEFYKTFEKIKTWAINDQ